MPCFQSSVDGIMSTDMKSLGWAKLLRRNLSGSRPSSISLRSSKILSLHSKLFESSVRFKSWVSMNISPQLRNSDVFCCGAKLKKLDSRTAPCELNPTASGLCSSMSTSLCTLQSISTPRTPPSWQQWSRRKRRNLRDPGFHIATGKKRAVKKTEFRQILWDLWESYPSWITDVINERVHHRFVHRGICEILALDRVHLLL